METTTVETRARTRPLILGVAAALVAFLIAAFLFTTQSSKAEAPASVKAVKPTVSVRANPTAPFTVVSAATSVNAGSSIRTDATGLAEINYFDGSHTRLGPATEYNLTKLVHNGTQKQLVGKLDIGRSYHRVQKVTGSGSRFEVSTSNAVAAVRGTAFTVVCLVRGVCEITVIEGGVALLDPATGQPLLGKDGQPIVLQPGQAITVTTLADGSTLISDIHPADLSDPFLTDNAQQDDISLSGAEVRGLTQTPTTTGTQTGAGAAPGAGTPGAGTPGGGNPGGGPPGSTPGSTPPTTGDGAFPPGLPDQGGPPDSTPGNGPPSSSPTTGPPSSTPNNSTTTQPTTTSTTQPTTTTCQGGGYPPRPC